MPMRGQYYALDGSAGSPSSPLISTGNSTTYAARDLCHAPANWTGQTLFRDPGWQHTVLLPQLTSPVYMYR